MKWQLGATKYRKEKLEELRVRLRDRCEKSLETSSYDLTIGALLEFGKETRYVRCPSTFCVTYLYSIFLKTDILCERAERTEAQRLHQNLIQIVEDISRNMPQLCVTLAGGSDCPVTHRELNITLAHSNERFNSQQKEVLDSVRSTLASWLTQLN